MLVDHRLMHDGRTPATSPVDPPYVAEITFERELWTQIAALCRSLPPAERERPGYYRDPDWSVKDLVAHLGTRSTCSSSRWCWERGLASFRRSTFGSACD